MSGRRNKPKTIADLSAFGTDITNIFKLLDRYQSSLDTGSAAYLALMDLHLKLCEASLVASGEKELPWVAQSRGWPWPAPK